VCTGVDDADIFLAKTAVMSSAADCVLTPSGSAWHCVFWDAAALRNSLTFFIAKALGFTL